jgi:hypothetical protein
MFFRGRLWNNYNDIFDNISFDENVVSKEKLFKLICLIPLEYYKYINRIYIVNSSSYKDIFKFVKQHRLLMTETYLANNKEHAGDYNFSLGTLCLYLDKIGTNPILDLDKDKEFYRILLHEIGHSRQLLKRSNILEYVKIVYENQFVSITDTNSAMTKYKEIIEEDADKFQIAFENSFKDSLDKISSGIINWSSINKHPRIC